MYGSIGRVRGDGPGMASGCLGQRRLEGQHARRRDSRGRDSRRRVPGEVQVAHAATMYVVCCRAFFFLLIVKS